MAISSSGSVAFSQIQSEWGGSNPISLSEYYSGSLTTSNTTSITVTPTVESRGTSYTSGKSSYAIYADGWGHTSITSLNLPNSTQSLTLSYRTGVDGTGNAGAIPSSGAIQANHFRGTSSGTNNTVICYGVYHYRDTGATFTNLGYVWFSGHWGTQTSTYVTNPPPAYGVPFAYLNTAAESNTPATTIRMNQTSNASNGFFNGRFQISHLNNSTVGNYTQFLFFGGSHSVGGFSGTWTNTFYL